MHRHRCHPNTSPVPARQPGKKHKSSDKGNSNNNNSCCGCWDLIFYCATKGNALVMYNFCVPDPHLLQGSKCALPDSPLSLRRTVFYYEFSSWVFILIRNSHRPTTQFTQHPPANHNQHGNTQQEKVFCRGQQEAIPATTPEARQRRYNGEDSCWRRRVSKESGIRATRRYACM